MTHDPKKRRRPWLPILKLAVVVLVCFAVQGTVRDAIRKLNEHTWRMDVGWLVAAGVLYVAAWVPMGWFWGRVLAALGQPMKWPDTLHAYFLGHLGKYVPGKALVLVIRIGLLRPRVISIRLGVASVLLETLTLMSVGAVLAAAISPFVLKQDSRLTIAAVITAFVVGLPTIPPITRRLVRRLTARRIASDPADESSAGDQAVIEHQITTRLLAKGWLASVACWIVLGWSMWATLRAIGVTSIHPVADLPLLVAVVALSIVAGFVSMLPGGMVVRDALLFELLSTVCGEADALVAAVLWRLVSLLAELIICGILEVAKRVRGPAPDH
ncbi:MAG: lysylphosphatidylglycerol synthase transmembrane domain-containing protein [Pirellulales bacterium]